VTSSAGAKGKRIELQAAAALSEISGWRVYRRLQEGRAEDHGDLDGVPDCTVQVKGYDDIVRAIREGLPAMRHQHRLSGRRFGVLLVRRRGRLGTKDPRFVAVMELDQFVALVAAATGYEISAAPGQPDTGESQAAPRVRPVRLVTTEPGAAG